MNWIETIIEIFVIIIQQSEQYYNYKALVYLITIQLLSSDNIIHYLLNLYS